MEPANKYHNAWKAGQHVRVLVAIHHYPPNRIAGAELRALRLVRWLVAHGHQARVVCVEDVLSGDSDGLEWVDDVHEGVDVRRITITRTRVRRLSREDYDWPALTAMCEDLVETWQPDIVHLISGYLMGLSPIRAAWSHHTPIVVTLTDYWFICPTIRMLRYDDELCWGPQPDVCFQCLMTRWPVLDWLQARMPEAMGVLFRLCGNWLWPGFCHEQIVAHRVRATVLQEALSRVDAIICITHHLDNLYVSHGVPKELVHVISYVPEMFQASLGSTIAHEQPERACRDVHFGFIGAIWPHKGVHILIEAFRRLQDPSARLSIMGNINSPNYKRRLLRLARGDDRIRFTGPYRNTDLPELVADVDMIVVPSIWHENAPRTLIEAFQLGKPVIGAAVGGIKELLVDGVNGLAYPHADVQALADCMQRVVEQPDLLVQFRRAIPDLSIGDVENERVWRIYQQVMGDRP